MAPTEKSNLITVGEIAGAYGVKGWVKVKSHTQPVENILQYTPWWLKTRHGVKQVEVDESQQRSQGLAVHIVGLDDRDEAAALFGVKIAIERDQLPSLEAGEYYWDQLIGLTVISDFEGRQYHLGRVTGLLETGANDVLVVRGAADTVAIEGQAKEKPATEEPAQVEPGSGAAIADDRERLIPYLPGQVVTQIDLDQGIMRVDWDPDF
jgi:16S rRNA processing protein RimM